MTEDQNSKCHVIIHTATASASAIAAGLAQIPGSDTIPITAIQITMIISLGGVFGRDIARSAAESILAGAAASIGGRTVSQFLVGWIPGLGNAINAATAAAITEGIGWFVANQFAEEAEKQAEKAKREAERLAREQSEREAQLQPQNTPTVQVVLTKEDTPAIPVQENRTLSISQMLLCAVFSFVIAVLCVFTEVKLENFVPRFKLWSTVAGIILASALNIVIFVICRGEGLKAKARAMMSYSNYIALVMNIVYSLVMSPVDLPEIFHDVHQWEDAVVTILKMPFINWGLAIVAGLWWFNREKKNS